MHKLFFVLITAAVLMGCSGESEAQTAYRRCQEGVNGQLVSPASAVYPPIEAVEIFKMDSGTIHVQGSVDSQNRVGVTVRTDFECEMDENFENLRSRIRNR
jgi:hypothetical protein